MAEVIASFEDLPVRSESCLPLGSRIESTHEKQTIAHVKVYPGANGDFTLYNDNGTTCAYEQGDFQITKLHWDDATRKLTQSGPKAWTSDSVVEIVGGH
jgi:alpha-D-xyloside xylohydrolase